MRIAPTHAPPARPAGSGLGLGPLDIEDESLYSDTSTNGGASEPAARWAQLLRTDWRYQAAAGGALALAGIALYNALT
mgnify:CR=1 FL=1